MARVVRVYRVVRVVKVVRVVSMVKLVRVVRVDYLEEGLNLKRRKKVSDFFNISLRPSLKSTK